MEKKTGIAGVIETADQILENITNHQTLDMDTVERLRGYAYALNLNVNLENHLGDEFKGQVEMMRAAMIIIEKM